MNLLQHQDPTSKDGGGRNEDKDEVEEIKAKVSNSIGFQNNLELCLGVSSSNSNSLLRERMGLSACTDIGLLMNNLTSVHDPKTINVLEAWLFSDPPTGFIDPWSLAARQQKAVLEQAHKKKTNPSSTSPSHDLRRGNQAPSSSVVGWPPVCAFRRNMVSSQGARPEIEERREAKRAKLGDEEAFNGLLAEEAKSAAMFVKVKMEGYPVGRKIDLRAHSSYDSLSHSLRKMFNNVLSLEYPISEEQFGESFNGDYLLLYEDHEGDRMLVGDVPWEMFLASVRRLHIVPNPKSERLAEVHVASLAMDAREYEN